MTSLNKHTFRKKPVKIEACCWDSPYITDQLLEWVDETAPDTLVWDEDVAGPTGPNGEDWGVLEVTTLEGTHVATPGDWLIKGVQGEFYFCKPDVFEATYEPVLVVDCLDHRPVQHRDARPPWCKACGLTADGREPVGLLDKDGE